MDKDPKTAAKEMLRSRKIAYQQIFAGEGPAVRAVLLDLAKFCRANQTTFHEDARVHAALEGRREVWLRIQQHLALNEDQLFKLLAGG